MGMIIDYTNVDYDATIYVVANSIKKITAISKLLRSFSIIVTPTEGEGHGYGNKNSFGAVQNSNDGSLWYYLIYVQGCSDETLSYFRWYEPDTLSEFSDEIEWESATAACAAQFGADGAFAVNITDAPYAVNKGRELSVDLYASSTPTGTLFVPKNREVFLEKLHTLYPGGAGNVMCKLLDDIETKKSDNPSDIRATAEECFKVLNGFLEQYQRKSEYPRPAYKVGIFTVESRIDESLSHLVLDTLSDNCEYSFVDPFEYHDASCDIREMAKQSNSDLTIGVFEQSLNAMIHPLSGAELEKRLQAFTQAFALLENNTLLHTLCEDFPKKKNGLFSLNRTYRIAYLPCLIRYKYVASLYERVIEVRATTDPDRDDSKLIIEVRMLSYKNERDGVPNSDLVSRLFGKT